PGFSGGDPAPSLAGDSGCRSISALGGGRPGMGVAHPARGGRTARDAIEARAMNIADALRNVTRLFLDSAPVIYYVEENPSYLSLVDVIFDGISDGSPTAVTSPVTLAE